MASPDHRLKDQPNIITGDWDFVRIAWRSVYVMEARSFFHSSNQVAVRFKGYLPVSVRMASSWDRPFFWGSFGFTASFMAQSLHPPPPPLCSSLLPDLKLCPSGGHLNLLSGTGFWFCHFTLQEISVTEAGKCAIRCSPNFLVLCRTRVL